MAKNRVPLGNGRSSYHLERRILMKCCEAIGTARAQTVFMLARDELWDEYLALEHDYNSPTFVDDYALTVMMSKNPSLPNISHDKRQVAVEKWKEAEALCLVTNQRWVRYVDSPATSDMDDTIVRRVQSVIRSILGPLERSDLNYVEKCARFGPGATSSVSGRFVVPSRKFTSRWDVSPGLLPYFSSFVPFIEGFRSPSGNVQEFNKVTFVPKSSKTDRAIAIEPHCNIYVQLGIGALLRRKLLRVGIDLSNQKFRNRAAVLRCQVDKRCTIDLANASDTVAYLTVMNLFPYEWFHLFDIARSTHSSLDGEVIELQKFSSMGNGYTFELETLLFYAICVACGDPSPDVFGDDIICRQDTSELIISALKLLGFKVNVGKTFLAGKFFESCGVDVYDGVNIRPFFLKGKYETYDHAVIRIANAIRVYANRRNNSFGCDSRFLRAWLECIKHSDTARKTGVPYPYDNGLWRDFSEFTPSTLRNTEKYSGWDGFTGIVYAGKPTSSNISEPVGCYLTALAFGSPSVSRNDESLRGSDRGHRIRTVRCFGQWRDLGPWL